MGGNLYSGGLPPTMMVKIFSFSGLNDMRPEGEM